MATKTTLVLGVLAASLGAPAPARAADDLRPQNRETVEEYGGPSTSMLLTVGAFFYPRKITRHEIRTGEIRVYPIAGSGNFGLGASGRF